MNPAEVKEMIERHLGKVEEIEFEYKDGVDKDGKPIMKKDRFKMSALNPERLSELYELMSMLKGVDIDPTTIVDKITKDWLDRVTNLAMPCLKENYPDIEDSVLKELIMRHAIQFFNHMCEQNLKMGAGISSDIEKIKARIDARQTALARKAEAGI